MVVILYAHSAVVQRCSDFKDFEILAGELVENAQLLEKLITSVEFYLLQCNRDLEAAQLAYQTMCPTCGGSK